MPVVTRSIAALAEGHKKDLFEAQLVVSANFKDDACPKYDPSLFTIVAKVGSGSFGIVYKASTEAIPGVTYVAVKTMLTRRRRNVMLNEKKLLFSLRNISIVSCYGYFETTSRIYLYMEYATHGVFERLIQDDEGEWTALQEDVAKLYIGQIVCALEYVHAANAIFGDVKPDNILVFRGGRLKLADFGLARFQRLDLIRYAGSRPFFAPEIFEATCYTDAVDWWALGIVMAMVLCLRNPFGPTHNNAYYRFNVLNKTLDHIDKWDMTEEARDIIKGLLEKDPINRLGCREGNAEDIKKHPWFNGVSFEHFLLKSFVVPGFELSEFQGQPLKHETLSDTVEIDSDATREADYPMDSQNTEESP